VTLADPSRLAREKSPQVYWQAHGHGPALVLINGFGASARAWPRGWMRELEQRFRVITLDNRGSGVSRFVDIPFSIADLAGDVAAVMDATETPDAAVFGISMGGMVAQELTLSRPDRVRRLILAGSRPPNPAFYPPSITTRAMMMRPVMPGESLHTYFRRLWAFSAAPGFADANPEAIEEITQQTLEGPTPQAMLVQQARAMGGWGHSERLADIRVPTLVVHGTLDPLAPVINGRRLAQLIPGARLVELADVGHLIPVEAPDRLSALICEDRSDAGLSLAG
jgi:pimeloyl-ACP methyl ester carboxylesterase